MRVPVRWKITENHNYKIFAIDIFQIGAIFYIKKGIVCQYDYG